MPNEKQDDSGDLVAPEDHLVELAVEETAALVGPVLNEMFRKAALNEDYWLKKKSLKHLVRWVQSVQDINDVLMQTNQAMQAVIDAQEKELEELRPAKSKVWTPFG